jgi:hypothetical protein
MGCRPWPRRQCANSRGRRRGDGMALRGANADTVIAKRNPIITGWAAYYRIGVSKRAFVALDAHMWRLVYEWASFSHSNKSKRWVIARYFGKFNPARWTSGYSGAETPVSICANSPGHRSSGTGWWQERRPRTTGPVRILGPAAPPQQSTGGRHYAAAPASPARPMPALPESAAARRP